MYFANHSPDQFEEHSEALFILLESIFRGKPDLDTYFSFVNIDILRLYKATKNQQIEEAKQLCKSLIERLEYHELNPSAKLNFEILIMLLIFSTDKDLISEDRLESIKCKFVELTEKAEKEETRFEIFYTIIGTFGLLLQIQIAMGVEIDIKVPLKYEAILKSQKESYINFFSSLDNLQEIEIEP
mmetsp:Transcript_43315/g.50876  ORF Transcript_43315/g.50876 Transcript_43315/m.50876 type:complete len:185 (-) Transcript_43315:1067-1621(-)